MLVTGDEILRGRIQERNAGHLARSLEGLGVTVAGIRMVGDGRRRIGAAMAELLGAGHDLVVTSGGLGPTHDDMTMQAVADATGRDLLVDAQALAMVRARSAGVRVDAAVAEAVARKQASLPARSRVLPPPGTAPGCVLEHADAVVVVLPGPPWELARMWEDALADPGVAAVVARADRPPERVLRLHGVPESRLIAALEGFDPGAWERLRVGICAREGELEVTVRAARADVGAADALEARIAERLGDSLFSRDGATVDDVVAAALLARGETVAVAESCTGGGLGARLTARAGSSAYLLGGVIAYADAVKTGVLGVDPALIARHGAVSEECAAAMARGVRERIGSDWALSITGVAGPGGGTADKPVGLVHIGLAGPDGRVRVVTQNRGGDREGIRARAVAGALHLLRTALVAPAEV